jgi:2-dehydro-3-deoxyphosphogluconate aldolase/(4S)-4-hydroxy-2-oxoglutarate aldolase
MSDVLKRIGELGIVPVVKIMDAKDAVPLGKALAAGDLPVAEITFRTDAAEEAIKRLASELSDLLIGAGTVLTVDQAKKAAAAGAKFIVSPGFNPNVVDYCVKNDIPITPGVNSPTTIEMALERDLKVLKFFPAEASGGLPFLKALSGPYGGVTFIPTGGVNAGNLSQYLSSPLIHAVGGTWIARADAIAAGKFDEITRLAKEAVAISLAFSLAHVGINEDSEDGAVKTAQSFFDLFSFPVKVGNSSVFAGTYVEVMKSKGPGANGHIAIGTANIERAVAFLSRKGFKTDPASAKEKNGSLLAIYLQDEISGFAVHLLQR